MNNIYAKTVAIVLALILLFSGGAFLGSLKSIEINVESDIGVNGNGGTPVQTTTAAPVQTTTVAPTVTTTATSAESTTAPTASQSASENKGEKSVQV